MSRKSKYSTGVFVFGSNLAGRHGAGAALDAVREYGAIYGQGVGRQGAAYAIPTKDGTLETLSIEAIKPHVDEFLRYARMRRRVLFYVTALGTGLAGLSHEVMAPLFKDAPPNCSLPVPWINILEKEDNRKGEVRSDAIKKREHP
ncbi:MAG: A1S_2505 family phage non-structural protein [Candidatus Thorarchaeota archaeon]